MEITIEQYTRIRKHLPIQRGNVVIENVTFINAILYAVENGCKWRALPERYGKWNSVYKRCRRWAKDGVLERLFLALQRERIIAVKVEILAVDSTSIKVHPDAHGALKKRGSSPSGKAEGDGTPNFMWLPLMTDL